MVLGPRQRDTSRHRNGFELEHPCAFRMGQGRRRLRTTCRSESYVHTRAATRSPKARGVEIQERYGCIELRPYRRNRSQWSFADVCEGGRGPRVVQASALVTCTRNGQHLQYMCVCRRFLSSKCTDAITERTPLSFLWRLRGAGLDETEEVTNVMSGFTSPYSFNHG